MIEFVTRLENQSATLALVMGIILFGVFFIVGIVKSFTRKTAGWIILTIVTGLLGLVCVTGVVVRFGMLVKTGITQRQKIEKVFTLKDGQYTITVPNNWTEQADLNGEADLGVVNLISEQYMLLFIENKEELGMNLEEYAKLVTDQTAGNLTQATIGDLQPVEVNGMPGIQRKFVGETENIRVVFLHTCVETDEALCQILCWTIPRKEKIAFPIYEKVLQTFKANRADQTQTEKME